MVLSKKQLFIFPPYWGDFLLGFVFFAGGLYLIQSAKRNNWNLEGGYYAILSIGILITLVAFRHYSVDHKGLTIRYLWIPIYRIPWDRISSAEYIEKWNIGNVLGKQASSYERKGHAIVVVCKDCPPFCAEVDALHAFLAKHPLGAHFIRFPNRKQTEYVKAFRTYYPAISYQLEIGTSSE